MPSAAELIGREADAARLEALRNRLAEGSGAVIISGEAAIAEVGDAPSSRWACEGAGFAKNFVWDPSLPCGMAAFGHERFMNVS